MDDDGALIERYLGGETRAFDALVGRHQNQLFWFILRRVRDRDRARDILQEVLLRMLTNLSEYTHRGRLRSWLFRIAHNLIVDGARRERGAIIVPLDAAPETEDGRAYAPADRLRAPERDDPERIVETGEMARAARDCLARLPELQREVFMLRQAGIPFRDIARYQRCSINTSLGRMHDAVNSLRRMLEGET